METASQEYFRRALKVSPGGVHSPVRAFQSVGGDPLFFSTGDGPYMKSVDGQRFIDYCQSFGPLILGHRDKSVLEALEKGLQRTWTFGACEPYSLELAEWLVENIPVVEKVRFTSSGTEAVMSAIRLARGATGRNKVLKFEGCYHGHMDSMLVKAGSGLAGVGASDSAGVSPAVASETLVAPLGRPDLVEEIFAQHGNDLALVVIEPLPANFGLLVQTNEFLQFLRDITKKHGTLLLFDEVLSGFRTAMGGMAETSGVVPDLVTYGKVIGGGFPVGCYGGSGDLMDWIAPAGPVYQAGTLSGSPMGMIAGLATLKKVKQHKIIEKLTQKTSDLVTEMRNVFNEFELPLKVVQRGSLFWCHISELEEPHSLDQLSKNQGEYFKKFFHACLEESVYFAPSGYEVSFMSWAHTEKVVIETILAIRNVAKKLKEQ